MQRDERFPVRVYVLVLVVAAIVVSALYWFTVAFNRPLGDG